MSMTGHASQHEEARVGELLRKREDGAANSRELVELALLYWEPYHREPETVSILQGILAREPTNNLAKLWLGYICVYYNWLLAGDSLEVAMRCLNQIIATAQPFWAAAARVVLYGALRERDRTEQSRPARIACLEEAVRAEPEWLNSRLYLASEYLEDRRYADALEQIRFPKKNSAGPKPDPRDFIDRLLETYITGRLSRRAEERLKSLAEKILQEHPGLG